MCVGPPSGQAFLKLLSGKGAPVGGSPSGASLNSFALLAQDVLSSESETRHARTARTRRRSLTIAPRLLHY